MTVSHVYDPRVRGGQCLTFYEVIRAYVEGPRLGGVCAKPDVRGKGYSGSRLKIFGPSE